MGARQTHQARQHSDESRWRADKSLSTYAHNVKIISQNGTVTLRGPVRSEDEKAAIEAKAKAVAGVTAVNNELTVAPKKENP